MHTRRLEKKKKYRKKKKGRSGIHSKGVMTDKFRILESTFYFFKTHVKIHSAKYMCSNMPFHWF